MTETPRAAQASSPGAPATAGVEPRVAAQAASDVRVSMVLEVLAGHPAVEVAAAWEVEVSLVHRWVRDFLVAGAAAITHRPDPDAARQRDRFLAAFAHELRTPVAIAHGWALELAEGEVPPELVPAASARLSEALTRLSEHITDVELSTAASLGLVKVAVASVDVAELCAGLPTAPVVRRGAELRPSADPRLLTRVLCDLCAVAHRDPEPRQVTVEVVESASWHEIRVVREGEPIEHGVIAALFDPFDSNDDASGVTMGLYVARALTVVQGGVLGAEGDEDTTVLLVRLPRRQESDPEPARPGTTDEGGTP